MWIKTKTIIAFEVPKEYELIRKFREDNPDYKEELTTGMIYFSKEMTVKGEHNDHMEES